MVALTKWMGTTPQRLRVQIQESEGDEMRRRRAIVVVNLIGIATMALTTLLQTGIVRRLPDPPRGNFDTKKVNSSDEAYSYGGPDSPVNITAHALNIVLASMGPPDRARKHPWLPLMAVSFAGAQAAVAAKYLFHQMPYVDRAWCPYCITDALMHFVNFGLSLPEAVKALAPAARRQVDNA